MYAYIYIHIYVENEVIFLQKCNICMLGVFGFVKKSYSFTCMCMCVCVCCGSQHYIVKVQLTISRLTHGNHIFHWRKTQLTKLWKHLPLE